MGRSGIKLLPALAVVALGATAMAAVDPADLEPVGAPNAAYLEAVRWQGLQTEVLYLRPSVAFDPWAIGDGVPEPPRQMDPETVRTLWGFVFALLLAAVLVFAALFGGRIPVSFRARNEHRHAAIGPTEAEHPAEALPLDAFLDRLRAMADRRLALILLTGRVLEAAAAANGLRIGRAQTARDVLAALPRRWPHFETMRRLVRETELVHFGGRELSEPRWRDCLDMAVPVLTQARAG